MQNDNTLAVLKWLTFALEALMAIPLIGGTFVISYGYVPLFVAFVLHLIALVLAVRARRSPFGNALGIVTSAIAWIPLIGWVMHTITALVLLVESIAVTGRRYDRNYNDRYDRYNR
ncbi:hypothetical protein [Paenibacillus campi]|uniref:hypothetical protein n=1 Tax=Paenibacillus campi TaxID=3106031 RepID=UPI002AFF2CD5|nr:MULTISPECIES: hypothetical protein [unclassified Paenibacillus]